jgi:hypothetical protein
VVPFVRPVAVQATLAAVTAGQTRVPSFSETGTSRPALATST